MKLIFHKDILKLTDLYLKTKCENDDEMEGFAIENWFTFSQTLAPLCSVSWVRATARKPRSRPCPSFLPCQAQDWVYPKVMIYLIRLHDYHSDLESQKYSRLRCSLFCKGLVIHFTWAGLLVCSGSFTQIGNKGMAACLHKYLQLWAYSRAWNRQLFQIKV